MWNTDCAAIDRAPTLPPCMVMGRNLFRGKFSVDIHKLFTSGRPCPAERRQPIFGGKVAQEKTPEMPKYIFDGSQIFR